MKIEIEGSGKIEIYYAEGVSKEVAEGKRITNLNEALFTVKFPN